MKNYLLVLGLFLNLLPSLARAETETQRMLLMDLKATLIEEEVVGLISNMITSELAMHREFELITGKDMRQMVELEAGKQAMGCGDNNSCIAELAGAMGARYVVFGEMGKLGTFNLLSLNLFDSQKAKAAGRVTLRAKTIDDLVEQIPSSIETLLEETKSKQKNAVAQAALELKPAPKDAAGAPSPTSGTPKENEHQGNARSNGVVSSLTVASGVGLAAVGLASATLGGWGVTSITGVLNSQDSSASQRELAIIAYRGAPGFILAGMAGVVGGAALFLMPHAEKTEE